jgi:TonB family protein
MDPTSARGNSARRFPQPPLVAAGSREDRFVSWLRVEDRRPRSYISGMRFSPVILFGALVALSGCLIDKNETQKSLMALWGRGPKPDTPPVMLNKEPPFQTPAALYAQKVQGNVTLRIFIDSLGSVHPESTSVLQSSGYPDLDTAAVTGARQLRFSPAKLQGKPVGTMVAFPVFFRHPGAAPLPGDSVLHQKSASPAAEKRTP